MKKTIISIVSFVGIAAMVWGLVASKPVSANPTFFPVTVQTSSSTTSPAYMTAGTATSTLTLDTYSSGNPRGASKAALLIQLVASSTATVLRTNIEYSHDGIDYYQDGGTMIDGFSTTSKPFDIGQVNQFTFTYASSTAGLGSTTPSQSTTTRAVRINTPTRFVRAVFTIPVGSAAGAVWAQFVPNKEVAE